MIKIWYLAHSAWLVETSTHVLLLDYGARPARPPRGRLADGCLDWDFLPDKPLLALASHRHSDHYDPQVHDLVAARTAAAGHFLLGLDAADPQPANLPAGTLVLRPDQAYWRPDLALEIRTAASTDQGIACLIRLPELTIYFGGDLAIWADTPFYREQHARSLQRLAVAGWAVDLAFIPVSTSDGYQEAQLLEGARETVRQLKPRWVLPMHAHGYERFYKRFATWLRLNEPAFQGTVLTAHKPGDQFTLAAGTAAEGSADHDD